MPKTLFESNLTSLTLRNRGKVRDIYDIDDKHMLIVTTDRLSAFDVVLPTPIPDKGRVLTQISGFWFSRLSVPHHLISLDVQSSPIPDGLDPDWLDGRAMQVRRCEVVPVECVVRGYLCGSGWKEYKNDGTVCGIALPTGLLESEKLPQPIFTPSTKARERGLQR